MGSRRPPLSRAPLRPSRPSRPARNLLGTVSSAAQTAPSGPFGPSGSGRGVRVRTPGPRAVLGRFALPTSHCPMCDFCAPSGRLGRPSRFGRYPTSLQLSLWLPILPILPVLPVWPFSRRIIAQAALEALRVIEVVEGSFGSTERQGTFAAGLVSRITTTCTFTWSQASPPPPKKNKT